MKSKGARASRNASSSEEADAETMSATLFHECLHDAFPYLDEDVIRAAEDKLFPVLWWYGFRPF